MLTQMHVQNYKCLRDVQIDLAPFTILIGPNDSGKSSLLEVVQSLGKLATTLLPNAFPSGLLSLIWRKDPDLLFYITAQWTTHEGDYRWQTRFSPQQILVDEQLTRAGQDLITLVRRQNQTLARIHDAPLREIDIGQHSSALSAVVRHSHLRNVPDTLNSTCKYSLDPNVLGRPCQLQPNPVLNPSGDNLVAVLDLIVGAPDPSIRFEMERVIQSEIPTLRGVYLPALPDGKKSLEFILSDGGKPPVTIPAAQASDGAMLLTAFLAIVYGNTPDILLIEEPENGLHPSRLKHIVELLRKISTGEIGPRPRQVIISTHSPILLNYAKPEEVRIFSRDLEQGTKIVPLTSVHDINKLLKEFAIGELWYMLGEEALLKETPA
jgi:predicted ATPase